MLKRFFLAATVLTAAVLATTIALIIAPRTHSASQESSMGSATVALLSQPRTAADDLPAIVLASPDSSHLSAAESRLAAIFGDNVAYVAPGVSAGTICLIVFDRSTNSFASSCAARSLLTSGSVYLSWPRVDGTERVIGLVGDGHVLAESNGEAAKIVNNVFALDNAKGSGITFTGVDGQHLNLDLGPQFPPGEAPPS